MSLSWPEVKDIIKEDDRGKRDRLISPARLRWSVSQNELEVSVDDSRPFTLSPWSEIELCEWLRMPVKYFRECPAELKRLQIEFLIKNRLSDKAQWRVRLIDGTVRAFVSEHYQPFDNQRVISLWEKNGDPKFFDYELMLDDTFFFLRALAQDEAYSHKMLGGLQSGVFIRNSEVGRSALAMGASVFRLICKNGLVVEFESTPSLHQRHIWIDEAKLVEKFEGAVSRALELAQHTTRRLKKAQRIPTDLNGLVQALEDLKLNERVQQSAIDIFISEGDQSAFGMVNALTAAARDFNPYDRHGLEATAWRLLADVTGE